MPSPRLPSTQLDAWVSYAIDPGRLERLVAELESHSELLTALSPSDFLASFSKAEALSWRIRSEEGSAPSGFAFVLLDKHDRVISRRDESRLLDNYLHKVDSLSTSETGPESSPRGDALHERKTRFVPAGTRERANVERGGRAVTHWR